MPTLTPDDRKALAAYGNAVVPQVAERIGEIIASHVHRSHR